MKLLTIILLTLLSFSHSFYVNASEVLKTKGKKVLIKIDDDYEVGDHIIFYEEEDVPLGWGKITRVKNKKKRAYAIITNGEANKGDLVDYDFKKLKELGRSFSYTVTLGGFLNYTIYRAAYLFEIGNKLTLSIGQTGIIDIGDSVYGFAFDFDIGLKFSPFNEAFTSGPYIASNIGGGYALYTSSDLLTSTAESSTGPMFNTNVAIGYDHWFSHHWVIGVEGGVNYTSFTPDNAIYSGLYSGAGPYVAITFGYGD